jgi:hypothetical protein
LPMRHHPVAFQKVVPNRVGTMVGCARGHDGWERPPPARGTGPDDGHRQERECGGDSTFPRQPWLRSSCPCTRRGFAKLRAQSDPCPETTRRNGGIPAAFVAVRWFAVSGETHPPSLLSSWGCASRADRQGERHLCQPAGRDREARPRPPRPSHLGRGHRNDLSGHLHGPQGFGIRRDRQRCASHVVAIADLRPDVLGARARSMTLSTD